MKIFPASRRFKTKHSGSWLAWVCVPVLVIVLGCANTGPRPQEEQSPQSGQGPSRVGSSAGLASGELTTILGTKDLRTGTQRVSFLLATSEALVKTPHATVSTLRAVDDGTFVETKTADFYLWPYGIRGGYSTSLTFDEPGSWLLEVSTEEDGAVKAGRLEIEIGEESLVPDVGTVPPASHTKILVQGGDPTTLTTDSTPDADLYQISVADALKSGMPSVIVFATPAFCTSPTCGPQVDTLSELKDAHIGEANFIHVELYDNPQEIQGDLSRARFADAVMEWRLDQLPEWFNESWTFVLNPEGRIHQRFEGFVTLEELDKTLMEVVQSS